VGGWVGVSVKVWVVVYCVLLLEFGRVCGWVGEWVWKYCVYAYIGVGRVEWESFLATQRCAQL